MGKNKKDEEKELRDRIRRLEKKMRKKKKRKHRRKHYDYSSPDSSDSSSENDKENERERERRSGSHASRRRRASRSHSRRRSRSRVSVRSHHRSRSRDSLRSHSYVRSRSRSNDATRTQERSTSPVDNPNLNQESTRGSTDSAAPRSNDATQAQQEIASPAEDHSLNQESAKKPTDGASDQATQSVKEDVALGEDMLLAIGKRLRSDKKLTEPVHKDIQIRWEEIYKEGLPKDIKAELLSKHPQPANVVFLEAPKLNLELKASVHESVTNRDNRLVEKQEKVAVCLSVLGSILSQFLNKEEVKSIELIEKISDSCRILVDLQRDETLTRRSLIMANIRPSVRETLKTTEVDEFLFGKQLEEQVKATKLLEKSSKELKLPEKTVFKHVPKNTRGPLQQTNKKYVQSRPPQRKSWGGQYKQYQRSPRRSFSTNNKSHKKRS